MRRIGYGLGTREDSPIVVDLVLAGGGGCKMLKDRLSLSCRASKYRQSSAVTGSHRRMAVRAGNRTTARPSRRTLSSTLCAKAGNSTGIETYPGGTLRPTFPSASALPLNRAGTRPYSGSQRLGSRCRLSGGHTRGLPLDRRPPGDGAVGATRVGALQRFSSRTSTGERRRAAKPAT